MNHPRFVSFPIYFFFSKICILERIIFCDSPSANCRTQPSPKPPPRVPQPLFKSEIGSIISITLDYFGSGVYSINRALFDRVFEIFEY